jgi:type IX secretion system PorP/SprF family membrane protein
MRKIILISLSLTLMLTGIQAQDFHLSQVNAAPHYFNPALTGMYFGEKADYRIFADYRSQWKAFGIKPFSTFYAGYDMPFKDQFGIGGYLISNRNGANGMNTIQFMPSGAYRITKDQAGEHQLTAGVQMGILYRSFDPGHFTYETQFNPDAAGGFDQSIDDGENFSKESMVKFDAGLGSFYQYNHAAWQARPFAGYSVFHLTRPNQSFTGVNKDKLPMRWVYTLGADWKVNEEINLRPMMMLIYTAKAHDLNIGATGSYILKDTKYTILGGLNYRTKDAFIIQAGMKYEQHVFMMSYDINTSALNDYTNGRGAFEISILLNGIKGKMLFNPKFGFGKNKNKDL